MVLFVENKVKFGANARKAVTYFDATEPFSFTKMMRFVLL